MSVVITWVIVGMIELVLVVGLVREAGLRGNPLRANGGRESCG